MEECGILGRVRIVRYPCVSSWCIHLVALCGILVSCRGAVSGPRLLESCGILLHRRGTFIRCVLVTRMQHRAVELKSILCREEIGTTWEVR